jgi:predicted dehydrogenase
MPARMGAVVVGTNYGVLAHVGALNEAGFEVRALVGRDGAKARDRAEKLGVAHGFGALEPALALPGVDVVSITTPPHTHAELSLAAISAEKHVLCEKPFALDLEEARSVLAAAARAGVIHVMGNEHRFGTTQELLRRVIAAGTVGKPQMALIIRHRPSLVDGSIELPSWWESTAKGGGWLGALGSHIIDQVRSTLGEFESVSGTLEKWSPRPAMTADDTYTIQFRLATGCTGVLHSSCAIPGPAIPTTKIGGSRGAAWVDGDQVWIDAGEGPQVVSEPADLPRVLPEPPPAEFWPTYARGTGWHISGLDLAYFTRLYRRFKAKIECGADDGQPPLATFHDGTACQAVLDAVRRSSAEGGRWVGVERP